jgi:hypothetical protein
MVGYFTFFVVSTVTLVESLTVLVVSVCEAIILPSPYWFQKKKAAAITKITMMSQTHQLLRLLGLTSKCAMLLMI